MPSLIDLLSDDDREKVKGWTKQRLNPRFSTDIPPELYTMAELGYYFGWGAVESCIRGYIEYIDDEGNSKKSPFTMDDMIALSKAAQKVWYRKLVDRGDVMVRANIVSRAEHPDTMFKKNFKGYEEGARI